MRARRSPTMPQTTLIRTPPRIPKISEMIAHQLVVLVGAADTVPCGGYGPGGG
jgi:hypothetical protein